MKLAICTSDSFIPLQDSIREGGHEVARVYTSCPLDSGWSLRTSKFAEEERAKFIVGKVAVEDFEEMRAEGVEVLISAGYDYKIPSPDTTSIRSVNIHNSLLPEGRGPWPGPYLLLKHPELAGITVHTITQKWDIGEVLVQEKIALGDQDDSDSFVAKFLFTGRRVTRELLRNFDALWKARRPMVGEGGYFKKPSDADRTISPKDDPLHIANIFRAFGTFTLFNDGTFESAVPVKKLLMWQVETGEPEGTFITSNKDQRLYAIKDGVLAVYL